MIGVGLGYSEALAFVGSGHLVAVAVGTRHGKPAVAWCALKLDPEGLAWACHPHDSVKAAQCIGALVVVGQEARSAGFIPA